jgi:drug/metabolite transporter (DMT)-like permease
MDRPGPALDAAPASLRCCRSEYAAHGHAHAQLLFGLSGVLELQLDGRAACVVAASAILIPAGMQHAYRAARPAQVRVVDAPAEGVPADMRRLVRPPLPPIPPDATCATASATGQRAPWLALSGAGACMAVYSLAFLAGIATAGVGLGTAVALGSGPVWAGLLEALALCRAPSAAWQRGSALARAGGVVRLLPGGGAGAADAAARSAGIGLCLLAGAAYGGCALINKRLAMRVAPQRSALVAFAAAAAVALPGAALLAGTPALSASDLSALLQGGVVTSGVAYLLLSHALRHVSAATCVTLSVMEPGVAFVLAVSVLTAARAEMAAPKSAARTVP